jgi:hypothetical protein
VRILLRVAEQANLPARLRGPHGRNTAETHPTRRFTLAMRNVRFVQHSGRSPDGDGTAGVDPEPSFTGATGIGGVCPFPVIAQPRRVRLDRKMVRAGWRGWLRLVGPLGLITIAKAPEVGKVVIAGGRAANREGHEKA